MVEGDEGGGDLTVSVVIPTVNAARTIEACLAPLLRSSAEIIVVDASSDQTPRLLTRHPAASLLLLRRPVGTPREKLRFAGLKKANSQIVALLEQNAVPSDEWMGAIIEAVRQGAVAGGGAVAQTRHARIRDWALYFARYYRFLPPLPSTSFPDFPAMNVFYRRSLLDRYLDQTRGRFAETFFHRLLTDAGVDLRSAPRAVVTCVESAGFLDSARGRYQAGRAYGAASAAGLGTTSRLFRVSRTPLLPAVFWFRCAAVVLRRRSCLVPFLACTPILLFYYLCWALGEAAGFLRGRE